jgi:hypothetical protein
MRVPIRYIFDRTNVSYVSLRISGTQCTQRKKDTCENCHEMMGLFSTAKCSMSSLTAKMFDWMISMINLYGAVYMELIDSFVPHRSE